jgi:hypothetical protein
MEREKENLNFKKIIKETNNFYSDIKNFIEFDDEQKNQFFKERIGTLEKFIQLILNTDFSYLPDTQVYYSLLGPFYELLIKLCLLKEKWKDYLNSYQGKKRDFEYAKAQLISQLKNKNFEDKEIKRIRDILDFIQIQRNNFLHSPFKEYDHYAIQTQFFELIAILDDSFNININDDLLFEMLNRVFNYKENNSGSDFEDVFETKVIEIYKNLHKS